MGTLAMLIADSRRAVSPRVTRHGLCLEMWHWGCDLGHPGWLNPTAPSPSPPGLTGLQLLRPGSSRGHCIYPQHFIFKSLPR